MTTPLGKYKLVKLIAAGGMAEVYLAKQAGAAGFEKQVCLKRILPHLARDKQFVDMFLNEARLASQLDHPNIVSIFDLGEANGNYFIAMEFIDGPNLRGVAKRAAELNELLPIAEIVKIIAQAAAGLQYAHDLTDRDGHPLGLVHRDISPDNILVHRNGTAKVVDFGIAKAAGSSGATRTGTLKGKVAYMPPEQLRGEQLDRRVDVFALGVVLYELIAGRRPWEADNEVALIGQIMTADPPLLSELRPDAPDELVGIVHKALIKDRDGRYQSCNELLADLEALIVQMGQSITQSRLADFVRAYSPPKEEASEGTSAEMMSVEDETFGTGVAAPLGGTQLGGGRAAPKLDQSDAGTMVMESSAEPPRSNALRYGTIAVVLVALLGSGVAWWLTQGSRASESDPVEVERAPLPKPPPAPEAAPAQGPAPSVEPAKAVGEPPKPVADAPKPEETPAPATIKQPAKKIAKAPSKANEPLPSPVMVVHEGPANNPTVTAKGELMLQVRPWAKVEIDGRKIGDTPLPPIPLSAGNHKVHLTNPDLGKDVTLSVDISPNERQTVKQIFDE